MENTISRLGYDPLLIAQILQEGEEIDEQYLTDNINYTIATLYTGIRNDLQTAYNYYQCQRDDEDFAVLTENYGVGNPLDLKFIPFIKTRINYLIGSFLERPFSYKVTCTDVESLSQIEEEKKNEILKQVIEQLNKHNEELVQKISEAKQEQDAVGYSKEKFEKMIANLYEFIDTKWKSSFEIAAQHILEYYKNTDLIIKIKRMLEHLIISGSCYYKITIHQVGVEPEIEVVDPRELYFHRNTNQFYHNKADRVLRVMHMTRQELLNKFGMYMNEDQVEVISKGYMINSMNRLDTTGVMDYRNNYEQSYPYDGYLPFNIVRVFHCEWIALVEVEIDNPEYIENLIQVKGEIVPKKIKRYKQVRFEGYGAGYSIFFKMGECKHIIRSVDKPFECTLSYNGVSFDDFGKPYSLLLQTKDLQDRYDIVMFKRENAIALSGVKSDRVVLEHIPKSYGNTPEERILKHIAYKKNGIDVISLSQEGADVGYNNYGQSSNLSLDVQTIQGYNLVLEMYEDLASKFLGVPKEMLGVIEERQAVGNVQMSSIKSTVVTLPLYFTHIQCVRQLLTDLLNVSKICFEEGKKGSYVVGNRQQIFSIGKDSMLADYNILVTEGIEETKALEQLKGMAMEFVKGQMIPAEAAIELIMSNSLTDVKDSTIKSIEKNKENQLQQLQQQFQEAQKQLEQMQKQVQQYDEAKTKQLEANIQLDREKFEFDKTVREREMKLEEDRLKNEKEIANKQLNIELSQLVDDNDKNNEPVDIRL